MRKFYDYTDGQVVGKIVDDGKTFTFEREVQRKVEEAMNKTVAAWVDFDKPGRCRYIQSENTSITECHIGYNVKKVIRVSPFSKVAQKLTG